MDITEVDLVAIRVDDEFIVDGNLNKLQWVNAQWSPRFRDMVTGAWGIYDTRVAMLWSEKFLYIAFQVEEPFIEAHLLDRDSLVFLENDVEVFIDGGDWYYELEINAANTIYEVLFFWKDTFAQYKNQFFNPGDDGVYTFGGDYDRTGRSFWKGTHPRGIRYANTKFDLPGLQTAVNVQGTLNDNSDIDQGWSVEIAIPWEGLKVLPSNRTIPPTSGDIWKFFLGRFHKIMNGTEEVMPHPASVLRPHGIYDTHQPEEWSTVEFLG